MSRLENKAIMGFYVTETRHHQAILSLVAPATPAHRLLDPFAGEGEFLEAAAKGWNVTPYANELDGERAQKCIARFGPKQAVRCDVERLIASNNAFSIGWYNPRMTMTSWRRRANASSFATCATPGSGSPTAGWCCGACIAHS